jgi:hypothetical protein
MHFGQFVSHGAALATTADLLKQVQPNVGPTGQVSDARGSPVPRRPGNRTAVAKSGAAALRLPLRVTGQAV